MTPRRVLHVATFAMPDRFGGAERVIGELAAAQARRGDRVTLVSGDAVDVLSVGIERDVERVRFPLPAGRSGVAFLRAARRGCRAAFARIGREKFDVLHVHQPATASVALPWPARARVASFYAPWSEERVVERPPPPGLRGVLERARTVAARRLDRKAVDGASRVVVLSGFSRDQLASFAPDAAERSRIVPPGVDVARFRPCPDDERSELRREIGWLESDVILFTVRRLVKRMGLDDLLGAFARAAAGRADVRLFIGGDGPEREALEATIVQLGIRDRATLIGAISEEALPRLCAAANLFVLPSRALEGFGLVTLEALACGTPVLATSIGANSEVLARWTPPCRPVSPGVDGLAAGIGDFLASPSGWSNAARAASNAIRDPATGATWDAFATSIDRVYDEALEVGS